MLSDDPGVFRAFKRGADADALLAKDQRVNRLLIGRCGDGERAPRLGRHELGIRAQFPAIGRAEPRKRLARHEEKRVIVALRAELEPDACADLRIVVDLGITDQKRTLAIGPTCLLYTSPSPRDA